MTEREPLGSRFAKAGPEPAAGRGHIPVLDQEADEQALHALTAEDLGRVRESLGTILDLSPTAILPGHGGPLDPRPDEWRGDAR